MSSTTASTSHLLDIENCGPAVSGQAQQTFTLITTDANEFAAEIHDRMPVIVHPEYGQAWLAGEEVPLVPFPTTGMTARLVSAFVNSSRNKGEGALRRRRDRAIAISSRLSGVDNLRRRSSDTLFPWTCRSLQLFSNRLSARPQQHRKKLWRLQLGPVRSIMGSVGSLTNCLRCFFQFFYGQDMGRTSDREHVDAEVEFNHNDLNTALSGDKLADYSIGRLMRRLEWHFEQSIVLFAQQTCLDPPVSQTQVGSQRELANLTFILQAVVKEARRQRELCRQVADQIVELIAVRRPSDAVWVKSRLKDLFHDRPPQFAEDAIAIDITLRSLKRPQDFDRERQVGLDQFVQTHSAFLAPVRKELPCHTSAHFELGVSIERVLCPEKIYLHMATKKNCSRILYTALSSGLEASVADSAGLVIGFHSFMPGAIRIAESSLSSLRQAMKAAHIWNAATKQSLVLPATLLKANPVPLTTAIDVGEEDANKKRPALNPLRDFDGPIPFHCCLPPCAEVEEYVERIHLAITQAIRKGARTADHLLSWLVEPSEGSLEQPDAKPPTVGNRRRSPDVNVAHDPVLEAGPVEGCTASQPNPRSEFIFAPDGDGFFISGFGESGRFRDLKGFRQIALLIATPNIPVSMVRLHTGEDNPRCAAGYRSYQPAADTETLQDLKRRARELNEEKRKAEAEKDQNAAAACQEELDKIIGELARVTGIHGKPRDLNDQTDNYRASIHGCLKTAWKALRKGAKPMKRLVEHFENSIRSASGSFVYDPKGRVPDWSLNSPTNR